MVYGCLWMFMDVYGCLWMFMVDITIVFMDNGKIDSGSDFFWKTNPLIQ